jgi:hypothetical protein
MDQINQSMHKYNHTYNAFEPNVSHKSMNSLTSATGEPHACSQPQQVKVADQ